MLLLSNIIHFSVVYIWLYFCCNETVSELLLLKHWNIPDYSSVLLVLHQETPVILNQAHLRSDFFVFLFVRAVTTE